MSKFAGFAESCSHIKLLCKSNCDFVIFSLLDKKTQLLVEVDGKQHESKIQKKRDAIKDRLAKGAGITLVRIKTTDVNVRETLCNALRNSMK